MTLSLLLAMALSLHNFRDGLFECVRHFESKKNVSVNHVFEENDEKWHRHKKAFWMGDSRLKMSTIHSFKGWEVPNVIVVIPSFIVMRNFMIGLFIQL